MFRASSCLSSALLPSRSNGKPEAATAVGEPLMMGVRMPETCWAVFKWKVINLRNCCIWLVDSFECMMMHGLANTKFKSPYEFARFEVLRDVTMKIQFLRDKTPFLLANSYRIFGVACFLPLQCSCGEKTLSFFTNWKAVFFQKTEILSRVVCLFLAEEGAGLEGRSVIRLVCQVINSRL